MWDAGSVGFFTANQFQNLVPQNQLDAKNTHTFRYNSGKLSYRNGSATYPVSFDVTTQRNCAVSGTSPNDQRRWGTTVEMKLTIGLHLGPTDCNGGTGIFQFVAGDAPGGE